MPQLLHRPAIATPPRAARGTPASISPSARIVPQRRASPFARAASALVLLGLLAGVALPAARAADPLPTFGTVAGHSIAPMAPTPSPTPVPTPTPSSALLPPGVTPIGATTTFYGRGYGHGVGLSQYGARGRANAGQDAATILAHYFAGTSIGVIDPATPVRVLLLDAWTASPSSPLTIYGRFGPWTVDGSPTVLPKDARLTLTPSGSTGVTWHLRVTSGSTVLVDQSTSGTFRVRPADPATRLELWSKPSSYDTYRGVLFVNAKTNVPGVNVVNELAMDDYLRGTVPAEMPSTWPTEALRAQAIVARSFAGFRLRPGVSIWDVYDDTRSQVYQGSVAERPATDAAIAETAGQVVLADGAIADTFFHSAGGGATENNEDAWVSDSGAKIATPVSYLRGSSDRDPAGVTYDIDSPYDTWRTGTYTVSQLSSWFGADSRTRVGTLLGLDLRSRGVSGRLIRVVLYGSAGTKTVSGEVFRSVFNAHRPAADQAMMSTLFDTAPVP